MVNSLITHSARLLFLLNNDYGELGLAMYFLQGRNFVDSSTLLLPPRLSATNKNTLPVQTCEYKSIEDIIRIVDTTEPDIVFLFSGYILPMHEIVSLESLANLVQLLSDRNCRIVTSDPFFGIFSRMHASDISEPDAFRLFETEVLPEQSWDYRLGMTLGNLQMLKHFATASQILRDAIHLYYACPDPRDEPIEGQDARTVSFFNPSLICRERESSASSMKPCGDVGFDTPAKQHWLFIIGAVDYNLQTSLYGETEFIDLLVSKLDQTLRAGRRPVLIAPNECMQKLLHRVPITTRKDLLTFCSYERFTPLLLTAEYVFYWNIASYSTFLRLVNGLPMFMFDEGHLVRHVKPMYERMVQWYYQNWVPICLNPYEILTADVLAELSKDYRQGTHGILEHLQGLPTPEQVVEDLLHR